MSPGENRLWLAGGDCRKTCYNINIMDDHHKAFRKGAFWQITAPLVLGGVAILSFGVWAAIEAAGGADVSRYAEISAVFLVIPALFLSVLPLALLILLIYGLTRLMHILPEGTRRVRLFLERVQKMVTDISTKMVEPILWIKSAGAGLRSIFKRRP
ncbi:MAG: hypothetical protein R6U57_03625 [Anaerolineales bacterium]